MQHPDLPAQEHPDLPQLPDLQLGAQPLDVSASEPAAVAANIEEIDVREPCRTGVEGVSSGVDTAELPAARLRTSRRRLRPRQAASQPSTPPSSSGEVQVLEQCSSTCNPVWFY